MGELKKFLTTRYAVALYVSSVLGSGVLIIPGLAANVAGPSSLISWILLAVASYPFAYTFASLSSKIPEAGGVYSFAREGIGARAADASAWLFSFWYISGAPAAAMIGAGYLSYSLGLGREWTFLIAGSMVVISFLINYYGISLSGRVQLAVTLCIVGLMLLAVIVSLPRIEFSNFDSIMNVNISSLGVASALIVWSYFGYENVSNVAEEFKNPEKDFQKSVAWSVGIASSLYIATSIVIVGTKSYLSGSSTAPFAALLSSAFGGYAGLLTSFLAIFIVFGNLNAYTTGISRVVFAAARDGAFPSSLSGLHNKYRSPSPALKFITFGSLLVLLIYYMIGAEVQFALLLTNGVGLAVYVIGSFAGTRLLREKGVKRIYPWISLFLSSLIFIFIGSVNMVIIVSIILVSSLYSYLRRRKRMRGMKADDFYGKVRCVSNI